MVDEFNDASAALQRAHAALKECARFDDEAEALFDKFGPRLLGVAFKLVDIRARLVEENVEPGG